MRLYLVQHGDAKSGDEDPDRPLTERGRADVGAVGALMAAGNIRVDRILHSGKTRARQTAEILADAAKPSRGLGAAEGLDPMADPSLWARRLKGDDRDLMVVGHLPHLGRLAALLVCGDPERTVVQLRQGGVLCLDRSPSGGWSVQWMVIPELVRPTG